MKQRGTSSNDRQAKETLFRVAFVLINGFELLSKEFVSTATFDFLLLFLRIESLVSSYDMVSS